MAAGWGASRRWVLLTARATVAACLLFSPLALPAPRWVDTQFTTTDGLPVDSVRDAAIGPDGFLWLATYGGLVRFDGQHFDLYDAERVPSLTDNRISRLFVSARGHLYARTEQGEWLRISGGDVDRIVLDPSQPAVLHVDADTLCLSTSQALYCPDGHGQFSVRTHFPDQAEAALALPAHESVVWMIDTNHVVWRKRDDHWKRMARIPDEVDLPGYAPARVSGDGSFWVSVRFRLMRVSAQGKVTIWRGNHYPWGVLRLREDPDGHLWVDSGNGVYRIDNGAPHRVFGNSRLPQAIPHSSWRGPNGSLWLTRGGKLWKVDPSSMDLANLPAPVLDSPGDIRAVAFGQDGTVWVMTRRDGLHRLTLARVEVVGANADGMNTYSISQGTSGTMWMGTLGSGLVAMQTDGQRHDYGLGDGLPGANPWLVASAPDGDTYVGTFVPGLRYLPDGGSQFQEVPLPSILDRALLRSILFDSQGNLWVGGTAGVWQRHGGKWSKVWPEGAKQVEVDAIILGENARWFAGPKGVWRQAGREVHPVADQLLTHARVRNMYRDSRGTLWISTGGHGLIRVAPDDPHGRHAVHLGRAQGLPSSSPHAVREDARGNIWVNSNQGIFRIAAADLAAYLSGQRQQLSPLVLGLADGTASIEGNGGLQPGAAVDPQGRIWFPTQRGAVVFDPLLMPLRTQAPVPVIDGVTGDGQQLDLATNASLPNGMRDIEVRYSAADLRAGTQVRFRYRLLPQDTQWHAIGNQRSVRLAQLAPGTHRFQLLAGNSDGYWTDSPTELVFTVPPYWHETWWFRLALALLLIMAVWAGLQFRYRRLQQQATQLDAEVKQRTNELVVEKQRTESTLAALTTAHEDLEQTHRDIKDRNQRLAEQTGRLEAMDQFRRRVLADVSHELRTPIMLVSLPMRELKARAGSLTPADRRHLDLSLQHLERLAALIEQLVGLVQAESGQIRLRARRVDIAALLDEVLKGFQPAADQAHVELNLHAEKLPVLFGDRQHLITIFGNLIDNALKHAPEGSVVNILASHHDDHVRVTVSDAGPGFDEHQAGQLFERFYRGDSAPKEGREGLGIGLALARELVELHGGRIHALPQPGHGATFTVELPTGSAHVALDDLALDDQPIDINTSIVDDAMDGQRILLVEDHPDLATYLSERLGDYLPVTWASSAEDARHILADSKDIRLVICDVVLPGQSGLQLCRDISAGVLATSCPVILISARAADSDREAGLAAGAIEYLAKPFGFDALLKAITRAWPGAAAYFGQRAVLKSDADPLLALALNNMSEAGFNVAAWAEKALLSPRQLRRRVKELTGQTPQSWLREQRLLTIRQLIRDGTCRTLAEAGSRCGMDNTAYLYRMYHARFGDPPEPPAPRRPRASS